jgi:zinc protease
MLRVLCLVLGVLIGGCDRSDKSPAESHTSMGVSSDGVSLNVQKAPSVNVVVQTGQSAQGVHYWSVHDPQTPVVSIRVTYPGTGYAHVPNDFRHATALLTAMLHKGTPDYNEKKLATFLQNNGVRFQVSQSLDDTDVHVTVLRENLDAVLTVVRQVLSAPQFSSDDLAQTKREAIDALLIEKTSPSFQLRKLIKRTIYGDHPYGRLIADTPERIRGINRDHMQALLRVIHNTQPFVTIVGGLSSDEASRYVDYFVWKPQSEGVSKTKLAKMKWSKPVSTEPTIIPAAVPQCTIVGVFPGISLTHKKALALQVLVDIVNDRLFTRVREQNGLVYGISMYAKRLRRGGVIQVVLATDRTQVKKAVDVMRQVIDEVVKGGITDKELAQTVMKNANAHPMAFTSSRSSANVLHAYHAQRFSPKYVIRRTKKLNRLKVSTLNKLAQKYLQTAQMHVFVHGKPVPVTAQGITQ